jgi:3-oxoacyl-[acyl-carrier-protein] synthase II
MIDEDGPRALRLVRMAAAEAFRDAGLSASPDERTAVLVSGSKPILGGPFPLPPETVVYEAARAVKATGPVMNVSAACATGIHSLAAAVGWIQSGRCDAVFAGAAESSFHPLYEAGFRRMGVLSRSGWTRPFDRDRDGFIMGEGAGVLYVETLDSAVRRGAKIYAEVTGWALGSDAHHPTRFNGNGRRMADTLGGALRRAGRRLEDIDYINAHGTATRLNDELESAALEGLYRGISRRPLVSSTKGATGHLLGAAGAVEIGFTLLAIRDGCVPPTVGLENPQSDAFDFVPARARETPVRRAASLSFGFGGTLAAVILEKL